MPKLEMDALLDELQVAEEDRPEFLTLLDKVVRATASNTQQELKWRLNQRLQGGDPGQPVNWRGL